MGGWLQTDKNGRMDFNLFMYATVGRRAELEAGLAGLRNDLYQRMLDEIAEYVRFADDAGFAGFGHPEHHLQLEGFEMANDPRAMSMWIGRHSQRLRVITCGFVSTTHNPLRVAEDIATLDHMHRGRFGVGLVRGYQTRWVEQFKVRPDLASVGPWNKDSAADELNREYFAEWVDIVVTALTHETFSYDGKFFQFPEAGLVNPHPHDVYTRLGRGVDADMSIREVGIAPRPFQSPHPPLYAGFSASLRTALFWAKYKGKPIVLSGDLQFCKMLWDRYRDEAAVHGHNIAPGDSACWGGTLIVAPTDAEAQELAEDWKWFWNNWAISFGQPFSQMLVGSPDTVTRQIEAAQLAFDPKELFFLFPQGLHTREQVLGSLDLFATKVMPRFQ